MKKGILFAAVLGLVLGAPALSQNRQPDLVVRNEFKVDVVTRTMGTVVSEQIFVIRSTIRNAGDVGVSGIPVHVVANGSVIASHYIPALNSGMESQYTFSMRPTAAGRYEIRTTVDPANNISEASEANNSVVFALNVDENRFVTVEPGSAAVVTLNQLNQANEPARVTQSGDIDLDFARDPYLSGAAPQLRRGGSVINLDIVNHGTLSARRVDVAVYVGGERLMFRNIGTIPAGQSRHVYLNWIPRTLGEQRLIIVLDPNNRIEEVRESNNTASLEATVENPPSGRTGRN